jgi:hypothetical protein
MRNEQSKQIAEQNASYRRGVVLGLTMAEVGILIIFVLLLLIGFNEWAAAVTREANVSVPRDRMNALESVQGQFALVIGALGLTPTARAEEIRVMVASVMESAAKPAGQSALREARAVIERLERIRDELLANKHPTDLVEQLEKQAFTIANQEGQLVRYESQLQEAGLGKGERPCWVKPDGTIEFLFDVVLTSNGIRMRENLFPNRSKERDTLPMPVTDPNESLTSLEFLRRTLPLYQSSLAENCRFFVTVYDATGSTEKDNYKSLLRTVEGHFYKRLALESAPF